MLNVLLETATVNLDGGAFAGLMGLLVAFFAIFYIVGIAVWVYTAFAYMALAKKNKQSSPGLSWIPAVGPAIVAFKASKMHWWPWLLLIGLVIPFVSSLAVFAFYVFVIVWNYKLFEAVGKPGWWSILFLIPPVGLIMLGIAAWTK